MPKKIQSLFTGEKCRQVMRCAGCGDNVYRRRFEIVRVYDARVGRPWGNIEGGHRDVFQHRVSRRADDTEVKPGVAAAVVYEALFGTGIEWEGRKTAEFGDGFVTLLGIRIGPIISAAVVVGLAEIGEIEKSAVWD